MHNKAHPRSHTHAHTHARTHTRAHTHTHTHTATRCLTRPHSYTQPHSHTTYDAAVNKADDNHRRPGGELGVKVVQRSDDCGVKLGRRCHVAGARVTVAHIVACVTLQQHTACHVVRPMIEATSTTTVYTVPISAKNTRAGLSCETYKVARGTQQVSICCSPNHYKPHQPHTVSWLRLMPLMMPLPFWGAMLVTRAPLTPEHSAWRDTGAGNSAARQRRNSDGTDVLEVTHVATVAGKHAAVERFLWHARGRAVACVLPAARPATLWPI